MQFILEVALLECYFLNHSQVILGVGYKSKSISCMLLGV
jgi:hypothetical protein